MSATHSQPPAAGEAAHTPPPYFAELRPAYTLGGDSVEIVLLDDNGFVTEQVASVPLDIGDDTAEDRKTWKRQEATAAFIVRACNSHAALVDGLRGARAALMCFWHHSPTKIEAEVARIDAAIAAAKGAQS